MSIRVLLKDNSKKFIDSPSTALKIINKLDKIITTANIENIGRIALKNWLNPEVATEQNEFNPGEL